MLDVGTGPGVLLVELARRRPDLRLTGVDLSADMIAFAGRNLGGRGEVHVGDVADLPFEDGSFDVIVSSLSLHHWESPADAVPELARVLRPGGRVLIYDFPGAPFTALADAAWNASVLNGAAPQTTPDPHRALVHPVRAVRPVCLSWAMLVVHVHVRVKPADLDAFLPATLANARASVEEPGVLRFDVIQDEADPTHVVLVEVYRDAEAAAAHKETAHYATWRDTVVDDDGRAAVAT